MSTAMKRLTFLFFGVLMQLTAIAQVDHYKGKTEIRTAKNTYIIRYGNRIFNVKHGEIMKNLPYKTVDGVEIRPSVYDKEYRPHSENHPFSEIAKSVLTSAEYNSLVADSGKLLIRLSINANGTVTAINFQLGGGDSIYSIPIERFEKMEELIMEKVRFQVPELGKKMEYHVLNRLIFFDRL